MTTLETKLVQMMEERLGFPIEPVQPTPVESVLLMEIHTLRVQRMEMLEACYLALSELSRTVGVEDNDGPFETDSMRRIRAAIAKATGGEK